MTLQFKVYKLKEEAFTRMLGEGKKDYLNEFVMIAEEDEDYVRVHQITVNNSLTMIKGLTLLDAALCVKKKDLIPSSRNIELLIDIPKEYLIDLDTVEGIQNLNHAWMHPMI